MSRIARLLLILRAMIVIIFVPHFVGKVAAFDVFAGKFHLSGTVTGLLIVAEVLGTIGIAGGAMPGTFGRIITYLGVLALGITQVGATIVRITSGNGWIEYSSGCEYNVTILAILLTILVGTLMDEHYRRVARERRRARAAGTGLEPASGADTP